MPNTTELVIVEGPLKDRRYTLVPGEPVRIGRTSRQIPLFQDDLASLEHAELRCERDRWVVRDLGSETGTVVNGAPVGPGGVYVQSGDVIVVGSTKLMVSERRTIPAWAGWSAALGIPLLATVVALVLFAARPVRYEPGLLYPEPVAQGTITSDTVSVPLSFVRRYGVDHRDLASRRVTDFDRDGRSELWLQFQGREVVVEVDVNDGWTVLGELPLGCADRDGMTFPDQGCGSVGYQFIDGEYHPVRLEGAIAWLVPLVDVGVPDAPSLQPGSPAPYRMTILHPDRLAGFLQSRGVYEPVHYIVCEEAFPGARAQALTESGRMVLLEPGCLSAIQTSGPGLGDDFAEDDPLALAFTATGLKALRADAKRFVSGGPEGLFLGPVQAARHVAFDAFPETRPIRLVFDADPSTMRPIAAEAILPGSRPWFRSEMSNAPPGVIVASIESAGAAVFQLNECRQVELASHSFHCLLRRGCLPGNDFITVTSMGCGDPPTEVLHVPYGNGVWSAQAGGHEVRVAVDASSGGGQIDVLRVRAGFREVPTVAVQAARGSIAPREEEATGG